MEKRESKQEGRNTELGRTAVLYSVESTVGLPFYLSELSFGGSFIPVKVFFSHISHKGLLGTAGDRWGRLGTAGDGWGRLGTAGDAGDRWGSSFVTAFTYGKFINWP